jgi:hypothetical protein
MVLMQGEWYVYVNVVNGTGSDPSRLFCVEGDMLLRPKPKE